MARPIRVEYEGALYHVTSRGNAGQDIFIDKRDCEKFLNLLSDVVERYRWIVHAYCLMRNHYHLLAETPWANLCSGMRQLNGLYAQLFNLRHGREGHLFQGRYKSFIVEKDSYLLELCRYIVLNPVRAVIVSSPEQWPWSSYRATAGLGKEAEFLHKEWILASFSPSRPQAERLYTSFVMEGLGKESPLKVAKGGFLLGGEQFVAKMRDLLEGVGGEEALRQEKYAARPSLEDIFRRNDRDNAIHEAVCRWGYKLKEVGDFVGLHYSWVSRIASNVAKNKT
jgi:putative transposase